MSHEIAHPQGSDDLEVVQRKRGLELLDLKHVRNEIIARLKAKYSVEELLRAEYISPIEMSSDDAVDLRVYRKLVEAIAEIVCQMPY